jgi:hypothetical protein
MREQVGHEEPMTMAQSQKTIPTVRKVRLLLFSSHLVQANELFLVQVERSAAQNHFTSSFSTLGMRLSERS